MRLRKLITDSFCYCSGLTKESPLPNWMAWGMLVSVVAYLSVILNLATSNAPFVFLWPIIGIVSFVIVAQIYHAVDGLRLSGDCHVHNSNTLRFIIILLVYAILVLISGGAQTTDFNEQWLEAVSGQYRDWHPFILPLALRPVALITSSPIAVNLIQIVLFAGIVTWLVGALRKYGYSNAVVRAVFWILVASPTSFLMVRVCLKDTFFGLAGLAMVVSMINIWHTRGRWLRNIPNIILFSLIVTFATFVRHNGFFFTIPFLLLVPFIFDRKNVVYALLSLLVIGLGLVGYLQLKRAWVQNGTVCVSPNQKFTEAVLLPMSMIAEAHIDHVKLPDDLEKMLDEMGDMEHWSHNYRGNINSIKSDIAIDQVLNARTTPKEFLKLFLRGFVKNPKSMWRSFVRITSTVWDPFPIEHVWKGPLVDLYSLRGLDFYALCSLLQHPPIGWLFGSIGLYVLSAILLGIYCLIRIGVRALVCFVPIVAYAFATMLFLAGWDDFRFFWIVIIVTVPMLLPALRESVAVGHKERFAYE